MISRFADPGQPSRIEMAGRIVGYGRTFWETEAAEDGEIRVHETFCFLRRDWRRKRLGRPMLAAPLARVDEIGAALPPAPRVEVEVVDQTSDGAVEALVRPFGFEPDQVRAAR